MPSNPPPATRVAQFTDTPDRFAVFYAEYLKAIPEELDRLGCERVFLLVSASLDDKTDRIAKLENILGERIIAKKVGVRAHTPYTDVLDLVDQLHESRGDCIVCVGSSSYSDAAKIALIVHSSIKSSELSVSAMETLAAKSYHNGDTKAPTTVKAPTLKLILVPTTLSAAEYNVGSSATHPDTNKKTTFTHPLCAANCVVLDPELCTTTPQRIWLGTGMRAVDHCVEALCANSSTLFVDESAEEGLRHLVPGLVASRVDKNDILARGACQVGAWRAMQAVHLRIPFGASHAIGRQLGSVAGVPHGETSCVMLPAVMKYNKGVNSARQERVTDILWDVGGEMLTACGLKRGTADAGDVIKALVRTLELPTTLGDVGVRNEEQLDQIAEHTLMDVWRTNPRRIDSKEHIREILRMAS
ncbi:iron-containing alcohol dehydrogenase [Ramaria rubella]|nr:iron-containing alcohol dehydrogenase [Ramaria rubella]KAF8583793.1 iron-containing alcohol dehydrogenase [Ramaria rubella]